MKKILNIIIFLGLYFLAPQITIAKEQIIIKDIPNIKLHVKTNNEELNIAMKKYTDSNLDPLYSLNPLKSFNWDSYNIYENYESNPLLSIEKWQRASDIAFYGYNYQNRTELKWYIITQYLIWKDYLPSSELYFIDENNQKINPYEKEIKELTQDLNNKNVFPSFYTGSTTTVYPNDTLDYIDQNKVLNNFHVTYEMTDKLVVKDNSLTLTPVKTGLYYLKFTPKENISSLSKLYYKDDNILINRGNINLKTRNMPIYINKGKLLFSCSYTDNRRLNPVPGVVMEIYKSDKTLYTTVTSNKYGEITFKTIPEGTYTYKNIFVPDGFTEKFNTGTFTINQTALSTGQGFNVLKKNLTIKNNSSFKNFQIYNSYEDVIKEITLNKDEEITLEMLYDTYKIKSKDNIEGLNSLNYSLTINNKEDAYTLTLSDSKISGSLNFLKKDEQNKLITTPISFKILNTLTNKYLSINENDIFTTIDGLLFIPNIPYGTYKIIENELPNYTTPNNMTFSIKKQDEIIDLTSYSKKIPKPSKPIINNNQNENSSPEITKKPLLNTPIKEEPSKTNINPPNRTKINIPKTSSFKTYKIIFISIILFIISIPLKRYAKNHR